MTQRFYFDTSVFGGAFDIEFDEPTLKLFEKVKTGEIICIYSDLTVGELDNAPQKVRDYFNELPKEHLEFVRITDESLDLAKAYVAEKVVGQTSFDDCVHIALATIHKADILVSWNFKHIVNVYRIRGYNSVNLKSGYPTIEIRSPKDIIGYEDNETD
jgi:predicted nucleic acid-binding protein